MKEGDRVRDDVGLELVVSYVFDDGTGHVDVTDGRATWCTNEADLTKIE